MATASPSSASADLPPARGDVAPFGGSPAPPGTIQSPTGRRLAPPRWLDLRLVLGVLLVLAAVLIGAKVISSADHRYATVVASRDLAAGTVVTAADVHLAQVQLPDRGSGVYLNSVAEVAGKRLSRPVSAGELVPVAAVTATQALTKLTIPFADGAAPGLQTGQRIEVWVSAPGCASTVLLSDVTVQSVHADNSDTFGSGTGQDVVVDVPPTLAGVVVSALALDQAQLRAGVLMGTAPSAATTAAGSTPAGAPNLAACASASPSR